MAPRRHPEADRPDPRDDRHITHRQTGNRTRQGRDRRRWHRGLTRVSARFYFGAGLGIRISLRGRRACFRGRHERFLPTVASPDLRLASLEIDGHSARFDDQEPRQLGGPFFGRRPLHEGQPLHVEANAGRFDREGVVAQECGGDAAGQICRIDRRAKFQEHELGRLPIAGRKREIAVRRDHQDRTRFGQTGVCRRRSCRS